MLLLGLQLAYVETGSVLTCQAASVEGAHPAATHAVADPVAHGKSSSWLQDLYGAASGCPMALVEMTARSSSNGGRNWSKSLQS